MKYLSSIFNFSQLKELLKAGAAAKPLALLAIVPAVLVTELLLNTFVPSEQNLRAIERFYPSGRIPLVGESVIQWKTDLLRRTKGEGFDLVLLGDSSCLTGLVPEIFSKTAGLRTINLGLSGDLSTVGFAEYLEFYLSLHPEPSEIIVHVTNDTLSRSVAVIDQAGYVVRLKRWLSWNQNWPFSELPSYQLRRFFAATIGNKVVSNDIYDIARGEWPSDNAVRKAVNSELGYLTDPVASAWNQRTLGAARRTLLRPIHQDSLIGLRRMLELAHAAGSKFTFVFQPLPQGAVDSSVLESRKAQINLIRTVLEKYSGARIYSDSPVVLPTSRFANVNHLLHEGALGHSKEIADSISLDSL